MEKGEGGNCCVSMAAEDPICSANQSQQRYPEKFQEIILFIGWKWYKNIFMKNSGFSVSPLESPLVDPVSHVLVVSLTPLVPQFLPFPPPWTPRVCLVFGCRTLHLHPSVAEWSLCGLLMMLMLDSSPNTSCRPYKLWVRGLVARLVALSLHLRPCLITEECLTIVRM